MSNKTAIFAGKKVSKEGLANLNKILFRDAADATFFKKYGSLFPGLGFAAL